MKIINDTSILSTLKSTFTTSCEKSPHCLMQLSTTEWDRCAKNSIQLKSLLYCDITSYESVTFGNNVTAPLKNPQLTVILFGGMKLILPKQLINMQL